MSKNFLFLFSTLLFLNSCVETVVVGTVAAGAIVLSDGSIFDLSEDSRIESAVKKSFKNDPDKDGYRNIAVTVYNGKILLSGYVRDRRYKNLAVEKAGSVKENLGVIDEIMVFGDTYKVGVAGDTFISSQISLKLKATKGVISGNYEYNVTDGIVFIMGKAENKDELETVTNTISRIKGVKKVISYIVLAKN